MKDSIPGVIAAIVSTIAAIVIVSVFQLEVIIGVFGVFAVTALVFGLHQKLGNSVNFSIMDYIKISIKYRREQHRYYYVFRR